MDIEQNHRLIDDLRDYHDHLWVHELVDEMDNPMVEKDSMVNWYHRHWQRRLLRLENFLLHRSTLGFVRPLLLVFDRESRSRRLELFILEKNISILEFSEFSIIR